MLLPDDHELHNNLSSFADGELDPAATRAVQRRLADDPAAARALSRLRQISADSQRVLVSQTPPPSDALRERLRGLAPPAVAPARPPSPFFMRWWQLAATAVAAMLLLTMGIALGRWMSPRSMASPRNNEVVPVVDVVPADVIAHAEEIHGYCSRLAIGLHSAGYPSEVAALAGAVEHDLHTDHPYPDLGAIGYRYRGAGPCGRYLSETAHLLYRSVRPASVSAVSIFVQPWHGQYALQPHRVYTVSIAQSPFPMLAWRTEAVVYFLIADDARTEDAAMKLIREPAIRVAR